MTNVGPFTIRVFGVFIALVTLALPAVWADRFGLSLTPAQLDWVGARIYQNECASRPDCLVHWNEGEAFPSLGIGHFIWYPGGVDGPFVESFPGLVRFARQAGAAVPDWLAELSPMDAPWSDRSGFLAAQSEPRMASLRQWLADTRGLQVAYILDRAQASLAQVVAAAPASQQATLSRRLEALVATAGGSYALIDYVNFKGEGLAPGEVYQGQGWGLLQVLQQMAHYEALPALDAFRLSAADVLTRRAENAERDIERERWLPGRLNRFLPPLQTMERLLFEWLMIGFILLTAAMISGGLFVDNLLTQDLVHKTVLTFVAWLFFAVLLFGHFYLGWRGALASRLTVFGFIFLMLAFFGSKFVLEYLLHRYG